MLNLQGLSDDTSSEVLLSHVSLCVPGSHYCPGEGTAWNSKLKGTLQGKGMFKVTRFPLPYLWLAQHHEEQRAYLISGH